MTITDNLTITGPGAADMAVSGGDNVGVFDIIQAGAFVGIAGLTIENGNGGSVTLTDGTVSGNGSTRPPMAAPYGRFFPHHKDPRATMAYTLDALRRQLEVPASPSAAA